MAKGRLTGTLMIRAGPPLFGSTENVANVAKPVNSEPA